MKNTLRFILFFVAFNLELKVKAQTVKGWLVTPQTVINRTTHIPILIAGDLIVQTNKKIQLKTLNGVISLGDGESWITVKDGIIYLRNLSSKSLEIKLRDQRSFAIPQGFEIQIGRINLEGQNETTVFEPIDMKSYITKYAQVFEGSKKQFFVHMSQLKAVWNTQLKQGKKIQEARLERYIATVKEKEILNQKQEELNKKYQAKQRTKYLNKVFQLDAI